MSIFGSNIFQFIPNYEHLFRRSFTKVVYSNAFCYNLRAIMSFGGLLISKCFLWSSSFLQVDCHKASYAETFFCKTCKQWFEPFNVQPEPIVPPSFGVLLCGKWNVKIVIIWGLIADDECWQLEERRLAPGSRRQLWIMPIFCYSPNCLFRQNSFVWVSDGCAILHPFSATNIRLQDFLFVY